MQSNSKISKKEFFVPQALAADLMGKQSVRATFRLKLIKKHTAPLDPTLRRGKGSKIFHWKNLN